MNASCVVRHGSKEQFTYNLRPGIPEFSNKTQELGEGLKAGKKESQAQK